MLEFRECNECTTYFVYGPAAGIMKRRREPRSMDSMDF